ncbi:glycosyltransferase [Paenibacillus gansuensis]|uniref:4,4'-diaponeurosporenoate glycosyltransferase n=1 Tax=Paenibacillus gansuensis TaxID=306542 RepID=A0ABW5PDW5_9BACL
MSLTDVILVSSGLICLGVLLGRIALLPPAGSVPEEGNDITVIIPARNEEANLGPLLDSLQKQTVKAFEVLVVDDSSTDRTAAVAAAGGANVIQAAPLPPGWQGKAWACRTGAAEASGRLLLFLDADTRLAPDALAKLASAQCRHGGLLAVQPYHTVIRPYEQLSAVFNLVVIASMGAMTVLGPKVRPSGAFGPCVMCRRDDYERLGGHEAVRGEVLENYALGRRFQASGLPLHLYSGKGTAAFRMYPEGFASLAEGWSKNFAGGAVSLRPWLLAAIICWVAGMITISIRFITTLIYGVSSFGEGIGIAVFYAAYAALLFILLRRAGSFSFLTSVFFPVPVSAFAGIFALSAYKTFIRRQVRWKGRIVDAGSKAANKKT